MHFVRGLVIKIFMQMPTQHHVSSSLVQYRNELVQDLGLPVPDVSFRQRRHMGDHYPERRILEFSGFNGFCKPLRLLCTVIVIVGDTMIFNIRVRLVLTGIQENEASRSLPYQKIQMGFLRRENDERKWQMSHVSHGFHGHNTTVCR